MKTRPQAAMNYYSMQEENQNEHPIASPEHAFGAGSPGAESSTESAPSQHDESHSESGNPMGPMDLAGRPMSTTLLEQPDTEPIPSRASDPLRREPAATASSYRDIIAERMARQRGQSGGAAPSSRPMAHSSDVERSPAKPVLEPEGKSSQRPSGLSPEIEQGTKEMEIPSAESSAPSTQEIPKQPTSERPASAQERARLRQQERAELRRRGAGVAPLAERVSQTEEIAQEPSETQTEQAPEVRPERRDRRPERAERERPNRESTERERPERERPERERPERDRQGREERERVEKRPDQRPQRELRRPQEGRPLVEGGRDRTEDRRRPAIPATPIAKEIAETRGPVSMPERSKQIALADLKGGEPKESSKASEAARSMALKTGISVVIPLYNEQDSLRELTAALKQQLLRLAGPRYEIIYVNDGSTDRSGEILKDILATSSRVTALTFRRNQGKSAALAAGFAEAQYGIVITMDSDLQDDPREITNLIAKLAEGYDLVSGWKKKRYDPMTKTGPSKFFNSMTSFFSGIKLHDFNCGLKAYRKEVTDRLNVYGEMHRYLPALAYWQGFRVTEIPVVHHPRKFGKSKFGSSRFFKGFLDLMSIVFTNRYGKRPLHLFGTIGTLLAFAGLIIDVWVSIEWITGQTALSNRPILQLGVLLILVGVQLISLGLLGEMIVKNSNTKPNVFVQKEKGKPSAEARERRASRIARVGRIRPAGSSERRPRPRN
ncbi:MAG TPA: glycosyltransferase [Candidatus Kapabacteria bacterium]|nr:glycosyltransferase [Candidatus Kapabacteria bacterium]